MRTGHRLIVITGCWLFSVLGWAQVQSKPASLQSLPVAVSSVGAANLLKNVATGWNQIAPKHVALNRTPPLYDTDEPAALEISSVDVRCARVDGKLVVQLSWRDPTREAVTAREIPNAPPETRFRKVQTEANDRFSDAAAVMFPAGTSAGHIAPSLQMGDAEHPVQIYYWNSTRGAALMEAQGRSTTRRTGQSFPVNSIYQKNQWTVTLELPNLRPGTPVAFAVWNGSQSDRDGRKYFSVWQVLE
jgi:hypothetical protein